MKLASTKSIRFAVAVMLLSLAICGLSFSAYIRGQDKIQKSVCQEVELIKGQIRITLERGLHSLPTIAYYKEHPEELKKAIENNKESIRLFAKQSCP